MDPDRRQVVIDPLSGRKFAIFTGAAALTIAVSAGIYWVVEVWNDPRRWLIGSWEGHEVRLGSSRVERRSLEFDTKGNWALILHGKYVQTRKSGEWRVITSPGNGLTISTSEGGETAEEILTVVFEARDRCRILPEDSSELLVLTRRE